MSYKIEWIEKSGKRWIKGWTCCGTEKNNIDIVQFKPPEILRDADGYPLYYGELSPDGTVMEWKAGAYPASQAEKDAAKLKKEKIAFFEKYIDVLFALDTYKDFAEFQAAMKVAKGG